MKISLGMKEYPTVRDMLKYIIDKDIPMDATVVCEQLTDHYLENEDDSENWDYFSTTDNDIDIKLIPAHNGFGSAKSKNLFVIWMHY